MSDSIAGAVFSGLFVLLGALIAYFSTSAASKMQFRTTVIASNRQQWINELRDLLANFLTNAEIAIFESILKSDPSTIVGFDNDKYEQALMSLALNHNKIILMLNPREDDHIKLLSIAKNLVSIANAGNIEELKGSRKLESELTHIGQIIIKSEWDRVRSGN